MNWQPPSILNSGIIHYADKPEFFESLPAEALQVFRDAPARWDETRCLMGEPGRVVIFARRSNEKLVYRGLERSERSFANRLDLSAFGKFKKRILIAEDKETRHESCGL